MHLSYKPTQEEAEQLIESMIISKLLSGGDISVNDSGLPVLYTINAACEVLPFWKFQIFPKRVGVARLPYQSPPVHSADSP